MRIYLDTEFNGHGGELISIGLVANERPELHYWYGVRRIVEPLDPWVRENVMPVLNAPTISDNLFRDSLHSFLRGYDNPEIICDWHADVAHLCQWMAGPDYGSSLDWPCQITILKTPPGQPVSRVPHNAVRDAEALLTWNEHRREAASR